MNSSAADRIYEVGGTYRVDPLRRTLERIDGAPISLKPKVFDTLLYLVEHRGESVNKDALLEAIWPNKIVDENNLSKNISVLRHVLGETPAEHRFIVTEPGHGYRFVADVNAVERRLCATSPRQSLSSGATPENDRKTVGRASTFTIVTVVLLLVLGAVVVIKQSLDDDGASGRVLRIPNSIAVLPLENLSPDPDDDYFAASVHREILTQLGKFSHLTVIAPTSMQRYAGTDLTVRQIADELNVQTVMEGSVRYANNRIRITLQLIDPDNRSQLWAEAYERKVEDIFAIQADIAMAVANALNVEFSNIEKQNVARVPTESRAAYALYLKGWNALHEGEPLAARDYLGRAVALDDNFAEAHAVNAFLNVYSLINADIAALANPDQRDEAVRQALDGAHRALAVDPHNGMAHATLAVIDVLHWRWDEAERRFELAVERAPNDFGSLSNYSLFRTFLDDYDGAVELIQQAIQIDPKNPSGHYGLGRIHYLAGNPDKAVTALREAVRLNPMSVRLNEYVGYAEAQRHNRDDAESALRLSERLRRTDRPGRSPAWRAYVYSQLGLREDANRVFLEFQSWAERYHRGGTGDWAMAYLAIGETEKALEWLGRAVGKVESNEPDEAFFALMTIKTNPHSDPILELPEFVSMRSKLSGH